MDPFEIGLTLTGTVSAGAYTGGVIDFLFEALEQWQNEKDKNAALFKTDYSKWTVPWHDVVIKGMSGASGGGVTNGLILNNIGKKFPHVVKPPANNSSTGNDFYDAWVLSLGIEELLNTDDLKDSSIKSLFNQNAIPKIADKLLVKTNFGKDYFRPYIDENLFSIITVTNLRGIPYVLPNVDPLKHSEVYYRHTDYQLLRLKRKWPGDPDDSYPIPYDIDNPGFNDAYDKLKAACKATCAFPAAFKAQPDSQLFTSYVTRKIGNSWNLFTGPAYEYLCSDGGILNTEPFQLLHDKMLEGIEPKSNPKEPGNLIRAVIIVAPLELFEPVQIDYDIQGDGFFKTLKGVIKALRNDAMLSDEEIERALDETYYSRYIIAPTRCSTPTANDRMYPAITGTTLGTFGAFLSQDFRMHDYFLGRRNAQQFLRRSFALPVDQLSSNPIFKELNVAENFKQFIFKESTTSAEYFPIIPLCGSAAEDAYFPNWPTGKGYDMDKIEDMIDERIGSIINILKGSLKLNWIKNIFASLVVNSVKKSVVASVIDDVKKDLTKARL